MFVKFLKNIGSYRKDETHDLKPQLAKVLVHVRAAEFSDEEKMIKSPKNRMLEKSPVKKNVEIEQEIKTQPVIEQPIKKKRGRKPGSGKKQKQIALESAINQDSK